MKRYNITMTQIGEHEVDAIPYEHPDGLYVMYDEAEAELARLRAELIDCLGSAANIARDNARLRAVNADLERKINDIAGDAAKNLVDATTQDDENKRLRAANAELRKILARALAEEKCGADGAFFTVATECTEGRCWHFQARAALSRSKQTKMEVEK